MDETYVTKKYSADKIVFLGVLIVSLVIARFIVASRSAIKLSGPITLRHTGLSVRMPAGNGWQSDSQWKFHKNSLVLTSVFPPDPHKPVASAQCRYILAGTKDTIETQLQKKASGINGTIVETKQLQSSTLTIDWAHIKKQQAGFDMFFGTVQLPNNRQLEIEVQQGIADTDLAEEAFNRIIEKLEFNDNKLLEAGSEIVAKIKNIGIDYFLNGQNQQASFLIKSTTNKPIGFTMDAIVDSGNDAQFNIKAASVLYIRGQWTHERAAFFQSDNSFNEFVWKCETTGTTSRSATGIILDETGTMTIREIGRHIKERKYLLNPAAIPDVFSDYVLSQMLNSNIEKIVIDIIYTDGEITPTFISRIETDHTSDQGDTGYVFKVEQPGEAGLAQKVYLDSEQQIYKRIIHHKVISGFERTTLENILKQFPERAEYIIGKDKILKQNW